MSKILKNPYSLLRVFYKRKILKKKTLGEFTLSCLPQSAFQSSLSLLREKRKSQKQSINR